MADGKDGSASPASVKKMGKNTEKLDAKETARKTAQKTAKNARRVGDSSRPGAKVQRGMQNGMENNVPRASKRLSSLVFLSFLLLASAIYVFLIFRDTRSFAAILEEIDAKIAVGGGRSKGVAPFELFQSAARKADSEQDYLRIFKRIYQLESNQLRSQYLLEISEQAVAKLRTEESLWAYRVSALLDAGLFAQAISASANLKSERYLPLRGEIFVHSLSETRKNGEGQSKGQNGEELSIGKLAEPSPYNAAIYVSLARLFREPRFAWNAALLYMLQGERGKALALVRELQNESWLNALPAGLIAYDSEDWSLATKFLEREVQAQNQNSAIETLQYLGDSYAYLEDYEKIIEILGQVEQRRNAAADRDASGASWQFYYNLASAYQKLGETERAFVLLREAWEMFPYASDILLLLNMAAPPEEREYARNILHEFIAASTDNEPYLVLASLALDDGQMDRRKFESRLWQLFSDFPENERILRYAFWYELGLAHTADINLMLERYQNLVLANREGQENLPDWILEYVAMNALLQRDMERAQVIFESLEKQDWRIFYNMANMYVYQADFAQAAKTLHEALQLASSERDKLHIYYRMVVIGEGVQQNYLSLEDNAELDRILRSYIEGNYRGRRERKEEDELFYAKLDSLVLWREAAGSDLLDEPEQYRATSKNAAENIDESALKNVVKLSVRPKVFTP